MTYHSQLPCRREGALSGLVGRIILAPVVKYAPPTGPLPRRPCIRRPLSRRAPGDASPDRAGGRAPAVRKAGGGAVAPARGQTRVMIHKRGGSLTSARLLRREGGEHSHQAWPSSCLRPAGPEAPRLRDYMMLPFAGSIDGARDWCERRARGCWSGTVQVSRLTRVCCFHEEQQAAQRSVR